MQTPEERLHALHAWQRYYHMEPRGDSALTASFVKGECPWPVDHVARELMATDFIYRNTLYGEVIEDFFRCVSTRLRARHPRLSWTATWAIVRFYAPTALKLMCLLDTGQCIPPSLPPPAAEPADERMLDDAAARPGGEDGDFGPDVGASGTRWG